MKDKFAVSMFGQKRLSREGGIEIVVKELCTRMAKDGCQVTCYNRSGHHVSGAKYDRKTEYDGICQKFVPTIEKKGLAAVSSSFFAALYSAFGKYDVVHIHAEGPAFFAWLPKCDKNVFSCKAGIRSEILRIFSTGVCKILYGNCARQKRWTKFYKTLLPKLDSEYDVAIGYLEGDASYYVIDKVNAKRKILWVHSNFDNIKKNEDASVYKEYFREADKVVSISDKCVQVLQDNYPDMRNKFVFLPNLTSSVVLKNTAKAAIDEKFLKDIFNIVSVGRLTEAKGFDMAIDALKILKERKVPVHWWIVGDGELRECLEKQVRNNGVEQYLTFLGSKSNPYPYMNNADLIVQASRWEGKSVVLDEAKILGKPILATAYATVKDQVINGNALNIYMLNEKH